MPERPSVNMVVGGVFEARAASGRYSHAGWAAFARNRAPLQSAATRLLRMQQSSSDHEQVRQRDADLEAVQDLGQTPVTDRREGRHTFDHANRMLDLGAHARIRLVLDPVGLAEPAPAAVLAVGEI